MDFEYKNILIMGNGKSGMSVKRVLDTINVSCKIYDAKKSIGVDYNKLNKKILSQFDLVVISPGISIYNRYVRLAEKLNIRVVGEMEFGYWFTNSNIIAITGTNGKTTTTSLVKDIVLTEFSANTFGNIGNPLSNSYFENVRYCVCEVSSFQLESIHSFKPNISIILNIAEDHLDRHKTFENYLNAKLNIFKNNNEKSISIINFDDKLLRDKSENILGKKYYFSKYEMVYGVYENDGIIYSTINGEEEKLFDISEISNQINILEDILAGILVGEILKIDRNKILQAIKNFNVSSHRLESVLEKDGVKYINDSKSTNIHSVIHAVNNIDGDIVLLLGGKNKNLNFDEIFSNVSTNICNIIAFGASRKDILKSAKKFKYNNVLSFKKFSDAVSMACTIAKENCTVLLSPGCASFDEFNSYSERGEAFTKIVKEINNVES